MLSNKVYDVLKWIVMIAIPAATTAYVGLSGVWGWPYATEVAKTSAVVCLGSARRNIIRISDEISPERDAQGLFL